MNSRRSFGDGGGRAVVTRKPVVRRVPAMRTHFAGLRDLERGMRCGGTDWMKACLEECIPAGTQNALLSLAKAVSGNHCAGSEAGSETM